MVQICPQRVDVFEPDAEPKQVLGHALAFPAVARLHRRLDAAEARRILDHASRGLDLARVAGDVEREHPAEAWIADAFNLRMALESAHDLSRGLGLAVNP